MGYYCKEIKKKALEMADLHLRLSYFLKKLSELYIKIEVDEMSVAFESLSKMIEKLGLSHLK